MMNRRSFLQSMTAAFSATALGATFAPATPAIRYELFCENYHAPRYDLTEPFSVGNIVGASDRRILLTHPGGGLVENGDRRLPNLSEMAWDQFEGGGFRPLRPATLVRRNGQDGSPCVTCFSRGIIGKGKLCDCCGGDPCQRCDDRGLLGVICRDCKGTGWLDGDSLCERFGDGHFNSAYVEKIRTLGNVDFKVVTCKASPHTSETEVMLFRGEHGVRGMLMSLAD